MVYSGFTPSKKLATNFNIGWGTMKESFQKLPLNLEVPAYFSYSLTKKCQSFAMFHLKYYLDL